MGAPDLLHLLQNQGLQLWKAGNRLLVAPKARITDETRVLIQTRKDELLAALADQPPIIPCAATTIAPAAHDARSAGVDKAELTALVNRVADHYGFTAGQRQEAHQIALADAESALECFRDIIRRMT